MNFHIIGVDPGRDGGVVVIDEQRRVVFQADLRDYDDRERLLGPIVARVSKQCFFAVAARQGSITIFIERQHIRAGEGGGARQVREQGAWEAAFSSRGSIPDVRLVDPAEWRGATGTARGERKANKRASIAYCRGRLPDLDLTPGRRRKPADGLADAGVIACYGLGVVLQEIAAVRSSVGSTPGCAVAERPNTTTTWGLPEKDE